MFKQRFAYFKANVWSLMKTTNAKQKALDTGALADSNMVGTIASTVYGVLKSDILSGKLKQGSKLLLQVLREKYNAGNSPLREALNRLVANEMVSREENKGFRVSTASISELEDIVNTRCMLEEIALRKSIERNDETYYEKIVLLAYRLSRVTKEAHSATCNLDKQNMHFEFHHAILSGCGSELLIKYCLSLYEQTQRYCNLAIDQICRNDHEEKDHRAICEAILDRNADKAIALLRSHYQITKNTIIKSAVISYK